MLVKQVAINASPLIVLFKSYQSELLPQLFTEIKALGIVTLGTGGILLLAKRRGLITSLTPRLQALREAGLWLSDSVYNLLKQQPGE